MKVLLLILAVTLLSGCSANYHLSKANDHYEKAKRIDPTIVTFRRDSTKRTIVLPQVTATFNFQIPRDTFSIQQVSKDGVRVEYKRIRDTLFVEVECPPDTVIVYDTKEAEIATLSYTYKSIVKHIFGMNNFVFWVVHIILIIGALLFIALKIYSKVTLTILILIMAGGLRFNEGKLRYDLEPAWAREQYIKVLTMGANKYADRNWEKGMEWSKVTSSLKRHLAAIEAGEDYDKESGLLHAAHVMCNAAFLTQYYKIYPEGDDRPHTYLKHKRIGLDVDGVIADFNGGMKRAFPNSWIDTPEYWYTYPFMENFDKIKNEPDFWLNLEPLYKKLPIEPTCYITHRSIGTGVTEGWLAKNNFPAAPVHTVSGSKLEMIKNMKLDVFVDDKYDTFVEINNAGILCYLYDAPYNAKYDVGHKRINSLSELA